MNELPPSGGTVRVPYGDLPSQFGDLAIPDGFGPFPVVVFVHGGFWRNSFASDLAEPQAASALASGYATWNIEYRRVGDPGGGYPGTLDDVDAAVDYLADLADLYPLDLSRISVVGHSAGGHLALWAGQRSSLPEGVVGSDPAVVPALVVGQAPVADLAGNIDLGGNAVVEFMGATPDDDPEAYAIADPAQLLPIVVPQLIVQGADYRIVPADRAEAYATLTSPKSAPPVYVDGAEPGQISEGEDDSALAVMIVSGEDHFDVIDANSTSWRIVLDRLGELWS